MVSSLCLCMAAHEDCQASVLGWVQQIALLLTRDIEKTMIRSLSLILGTKFCCHIFPPPEIWPTRMNELTHSKDNIMFVL